MSIHTKPKQVGRVLLEWRPRTRGNNAHPGPLRSTGRAVVVGVTANPDHDFSRTAPRSTVAGRPGDVSEMTANSNRRSNGGMKPDGVVRTQAAWNSLAAPHRRNITALRRRLLRLSVRLWWHPYWDTAALGADGAHRAAAAGPHPVSGLRIATHDGRPGARRPGKLSRISASGC